MSNPMQFSDLELALLTRHLLQQYKPATLNKQAEMNQLFTELQLTAFERKSFTMEGLSRSLADRSLSPQLVPTLLEALNCEMTGATARVIGGGSPLFMRLVQGFEKGDDGGSPAAPDGKSAPPEAQA